MTSLCIGFLCSLLAALAMGCTATVSPTVQAFGLSHRQARANQTLNPSASTNLKPVEGFNGGAAQLAMDRYRRSFRDVPTRHQRILRSDGITE